MLALCCLLVFPFLSSWVGVDLAAISKAQSFVEGLPRRLFTIAIVQLLDNLVNVAIRNQRVRLYI